MTERKPPWTSWETWIDAQVRVATEKGAFDNLPGAGKPLPNLDEVYDPLWWVKHLVKREEISVLPPSLELLRKVERELAAIEKLDDEATVRRRVDALNVEMPRSTRPWWRGRRRVSARWTSIRSWRVGGGPAPPILGSSPVSGLPETTKHVRGPSAAHHSDGPCTAFLRPDPVNLLAATQTARDHVGAGARGGVGEVLFVGRDKR